MAPITVCPFDVSMIVVPSGGALATPAVPAMPGPVLDDHLLLPSHGELLGNSTGQNVGHAAGRKRHHDPDHLVRVGLRRIGGLGRRPKYS